MTADCFRCNFIVVKAATHGECQRCLFERLLMGIIFGGHSDPVHVRLSVWEEEGMEMAILGSRREGL
jgi:hypothetical protein